LGPGGISKTETLGLSQRIRLRSWYIENRDIRIEPKDKIEVAGSRITYQGKPAIIAAKVKKGDEVLKLRDENGLPVWAGWRKS